LPTISFQLRDEDGGSGVDASSLSFVINGASVAYNAPGMTLTAVTNGYNGSYAVQTALSEGEQEVSVSVSDNDGNESTVSTVRFVVATAPPVLNILLPIDGTITSAAAQTVVGVTNNAQAVSPATVQIILNSVDQGSVTIDSEGNFEKPITLTEGSNSITVIATDVAGNTSTVNIAITLDTSAPVFTSASVAPNPVDVGGTVIITIGVSG
jgi:uncharacterized protein YfaP (DUF2135 family)